MESSSKRSGSSSYVDHTYKSYISPWFNSLEQAAEALLRCLGLRSPADETTPTITTNHHRKTPQSISTEEEEVEGVGVVKSRSIEAGALPPPIRAAAVRLNNISNTNSRKPPKPPVSSGKGGKTNSASG